MSLIETRIPSEEDRFMSNASELTLFVHGLVKEVYNQGYQIVNPQLVEIAGHILNGFNKSDVIVSFITYSYPHWNSIRNKNKNFFVENAGKVFGDLPVSNVDAFKDLFIITDRDGNPVVSDENVEILWDFFHALVKISIKYIHRKRSPKLRVEAMKTICEYDNNYFSEIELTKHAELWEVRLDYLRN